MSSHPIPDLLQQLTTHSTQPDPKRGAEPTPGPNEKYIVSLYMDLVGHPPDRNSLVRYEAEMTLAGGVRAPVERSILGLPEVDTYLAYATMNEIYLKYLSRRLRPIDRLHWPLLRSGMQMLLTDIFSSDEYYRIAQGQ